MCKSDEPSEFQNSSPAPSASAGKSFEIDANRQEQQQEEQNHEEVISQDEASGVVVIGTFTAGVLVGIAISAPAFVVFLMAAGSAAMCSSDSKVRVHLPLEPRYSYIQ